MCANFQIRFQKMFVFSNNCFKKCIFKLTLHTHSIFACWCFVPLNKNYTLCVRLHIVYANTRYSRCYKVYTSQMPFFVVSKIINILFLHKIWWVSVAKSWCPLVNLANSSGLLLQNWRRKRSIFVRNRSWTKLSICART